MVCWKTFSIFPFLKFLTKVACWICPWQPDYSSDYWPASVIQNIASYRKKNLWSFFNLKKKILFYCFQSYKNLSHPSRYFLFAIYISSEFMSVSSKYFLIYLKSHLDQDWEFDRLGSKGGKFYIIFIMLLLKHWLSATWAYILKMVKHQPNSVEIWNSVKNHLTITRFV